jgi:hypothetical protein
LRSNAGTTFNNPWSVVFAQTVVQPRLKRL